MSTDQQIQELTKVVNSHASDIQTLTAIVFGLASQLYAAQGEEGIEAAKGRALNVAKSMGSPFGARPNTQRIATIFDSAKVPS